MIKLRIIKQFGIIVGLWIIGEIIHKLLHLVIPGSIIGMILLLFLMQTGVVKEKDIKEVSDFLLGNLAFFFIPAGVGLITLSAILRDSWWKISVIIILSTIVVTAVTGLIVQRMVEKKVRK